MFKRKHRDIKKVKILLYTACYFSYYYQRRRYWVHPICKQRDQDREYRTLCVELEKFPDKYHTYFRMSQEMFDVLLKHINPYIEPVGSNFRKPIEAKLKLVLTLRLVRR